MTTLLYGPDYIGKEQLVKELGCEIWTVDELLETYTYPKKLAISDFGTFYNAILELVCEEENCDHPSDMGVGKAGIWRKIKDRMSNLVYTLSEKVPELYLITPMEVSHVDHSFYTGHIYGPKLDWISKEILPNICERTLAYIPVFATTKDGKRKETKVMICSIRPDVYAGDATGELPKQIPEKLIIKTLQKGA